MSVDFASQHRRKRPSQRSGSKPIWAIFMTVVAILLLLSLGLLAQKHWRLSHKTPHQPVALTPKKKQLKKITPKFQYYQRLSQPTSHNPTVVMPSGPLVEDAKQYAVFLASFRREEDASAFCEELRQMGLSPSIQLKKQWFRVCFGPYAEKKSARSMMVYLERLHFKSHLERISADVLVNDSGS